MRSEMYLTACTFKRKQSSEPECGLLINDGELIVDMQGKPVKAPIWNYHPTYTQLSVVYKNWLKT